MEQWTLVETDDFLRDRKHGIKNSPDGTAAVLNNLDTYFRTLCRVGNPLQVTGGFIHNEPDGMKGLDQKGAGRKLQETRLYVYPDTRNCQLHLLRIGTKKAQKEDIQMCREYVRKLRKRRFDPNEQ
jgi:hypothetical protein